MKCPTCTAPTTVYDTGHTQDTVIRRRKCMNGHKFITVERVNWKAVFPHHRKG